MPENHKQTAYEKYKILKRTALEYAQINEKKETGEIKEDIIRQYAARIASNEATINYCLNKNNPIKDCYPLIEAGFKKYARLSNEFGNNSLEDIVSSTPNKELKQGLFNIVPDSKKVGKKYQEAAKFHKKLIEMGYTISNYNNEDLEDSERESLFKKMKKTDADYYNSVTDEDDIELKEALEFLLDNSQIFVENIYSNLASINNNKFQEKTKNHEKEYIAGVIGPDKENRERFYQAIVLDPPKKESKQNTAGYVGPNRQQYSNAA